MEGLAVAWAAGEGRAVAGGALLEAWVGMGLAVAGTAGEGGAVAEGALLEAWVGMEGLAVAGVTE